ncbi:MAG: diacylglycerol kinase family lipid kinase, partial [Bacteroidales bacterium]|nr:diacylglycerol kinase family lipid kinase [Bacteroidales bacterium]
KWAGRAAMITVGNVNQWGNQARITPLASVTDGLFDITIVEPFRTWEIPSLALKLLTGQAHKSRRTVCLRGAEVMIHRSSEGAMHYDGDPCEEGKEIKITMVPAALRVAAPDNKKI